MIIGHTKLAAEDDPGYGDSAVEKKAVRASVQAIETALEAARAATDNPALEVELEWEGYAAFIDTLTKEQERSKANAYGLAGDLVSEGLYSLAALMDDPDFKNAAKTLRVWSAKPVYDSRSSSDAQTYERNGTTMHVTFHPCVSSGGASKDGVMNAL